MTAQRRLSAPLFAGDDASRRQGLSARELSCAVDWDFESATSELVHTLHPYPAKFIPQIPRTLIQSLMPHKRGIVLDPFCGSGTTLVEAIDERHDAVGIDLHPLACLIATVKTHPLPANFFDRCLSIVDSAREHLRAGTVRVPPIPRVDHWFKTDVQLALSALVQCISGVEEPRTRDGLRVALSSIVVQVSNQESDTRYAAVDKPVTGPDVFPLFARACGTVSKALDGFFRAGHNDKGTARVLNRDILAVAPSDIPGGVDLVVASPPYPNVYEYWLYHKYRMYWLGMDPIAVRSREIGARPHYFKANHQDETDFERQMSQVFHLLARVATREAKVCFLIGRSIIHGRTIDNVALLERAAVSSGFGVEGVVERRIPTHRKAFNPRFGSAAREHLVIFARKWN